MKINRRFGGEPTSADEQSTAVPVTTDASETTFKALGVPPEQTRLAGYAIARSGDLPPPKRMPVPDLLALARAANFPDNVERTFRDRICSPLTGIRAYCVLCKGGSPSQASACQETACALWSFRRGKNPFYGRLNGDHNAEATE